MADSYTPNLGLRKPDPNSLVDINIINNNYDLIDEIPKDIMDQLIPKSSWTECPITDTTNWANYTSGTPIVCKEIAGGLAILGTLSCKTAGYVDGSTPRQFSQIPTGVRTSVRTQVFICQSSGNDRWALTVGSDGNLSAMRHGPGSNSANNWMPFTAWCPY